MLLRGRAAVGQTLMLGGVVWPGVVVALVLRLVRMRVSQGAAELHMLDYLRHCLVTLFGSSF
jgi:hypothetical protein